VLVTWHVARTFHQPWWILPTRKDWGKVPRILSGRWPAPLPEIITDPAQVRLTDVFALDTEYVRDEDQLIRMSLGGTDGSVYVLEAQDLVDYYHETVQTLRWGLQSSGIHMLDLLGAAECAQAGGLSSAAVAFQGEMVPGVLPLEAQCRKGSLDHAKGLSGAATRAGKPLSALWQAGRYVTPTEARSRPRPYDWPVPGADLSAVQHGAGFIPGRSGCAPEGAWLPRIISQFSPADVRYAQEFLPFGFYLDDTVWLHATLWSDHQHDLNYLASIYGPWNRHKHLAEGDPILYAGLDAAVLMYIWKALQQELDADPLSRKVWEEIDRPALPEFVAAMYRGIRTDPERVQQAIAQLQAEVDEAGKQARAITGWPVKLSSNPQVAKRLYDHEGIKPQR
jgi:hypothetical protein